MKSPEVEELDEIIMRVYEGEFGFRANHREVFQGSLLVVDRNYELTGVNGHLVRYGFQRWVAQRVTAVFNRTRDGLPFAPIVNSRRQHVPVEHATFPEMEFIARRYVKRGETEFSQAHRVGAMAKDVYGRDLVVDGINLSHRRAA